MKIQFKKKRLYFNLILGVIWITLGLFSLFEDDKRRWTDYIYIVLGIFYIIHFIYDYVNQYLIIENETIKKNILYGFGKKLKLNEIIAIKEFAGDYTLKTDTATLTINTNLIDKTSLSQLKSLLENLNLSADNTPFKTIES
ncbi:hypothetical protein SCB49_10247 [unidentified eubacterium SCB49]|nr:hypothetical protein SCB49_10247 [unidentified eubacterium SCB49]